MVARSWSDALYILHMLVMSELMGERMAENRKSKRHRKRLIVKFGACAERRISFTKDISTKGLFLETGRVVSPGSLIHMDLILHDDSLVAMEGLVVWAKRTPPRLSPRLTKGGMGVKITRIIQGDEAFSALCEHLGKR